MNVKKSSDKNAPKNFEATSISSVQSGWNVDLGGSNFPSIIQRGSVSIFTSSIHEASISVLSLSVITSFKGIR